MKSDMYLFKNKNIPYFKFPVFEKFPEITHGIFTRKGGHSSDAYSSLNAGFNSGDDLESVRKNRALILETIGGNLLVSVKQVHGTEALILSKDAWDAELLDSLKPQNADAIITDIPGITLMIQVADCQSVLLYDFSKRVIANIHSGWRGSINNIIGRTIDVMVRNFGSLPENIIAGIGPSLGPCCAEFIHYREEIPGTLWKYKTASDYFDFWTMSKDQLLSRGLKYANIAIGNMCTKCNSDMCYSYRKEKITGRLACTIGLK